MNRKIKINSRDESLYKISELLKKPQSKLWLKLNCANDKFELEEKYKNILFELEEKIYEAASVSSIEEFEELKQKKRFLQILSNLQKQFKID